MWRYLQAAFWVRPQVPWLGAIPVNLVGLTGFGILGFGHPGFWLLGSALEAAFLYGLTTNPRFQRLVDAGDLQIEETSAEKQRQALIVSLTPDRRELLARVERKCARIVQLYHDSQTEDFIIESNREALQKLSWLYLKLLVGQQNLVALQDGNAESDLQRQIEAIGKDLRYDKISPSLKESKEATLKILQKRLANLERREQSLEEIGSDLTRLEAQIDLAVENAGMRGKTETISTNIDLVSQLLDDSIYGDSGASIAVLDETFNRTVPPASA